MRNIITITFSLIFLIFNFTYAEDNFKVFEGNLKCNCTSEICDYEDAMKGINHLHKTKFLSSTTILCARSIIRKGTCNCVNGKLHKDDETRVKRSANTTPNTIKDLKMKIDKFCGILTANNINEFKEICDLLIGNMTTTAKPGSKEEALRKAFKVVESFVNTFFNNWPFRTTTMPMPTPMPTLMPMPMRMM